METKRIASYAVLFALSLTLEAHVFGQDQNHSRTMDAFMTVGWSKLWHGDDDHGAGIDVGGRFGFQPFGGKLSGLGVQGTFDRTEIHGGEISSDGNVTMGSADAVWHFGPPNAQGFVSCGVGVMRADYSWTGSTYFGTQDVPVRSISATKIMIPLGFGLKFAVTKHLSIRPELRFIDGSVGKGFNHAMLMPSIGIGYQR